MIYIIEDEDALRELMATELDLLGYESCAIRCQADLDWNKVASDGRLIIADLGAVNGGNELLHKVNSLPNPIPVIATTGSLRWDLRGLFEQGVTAYFPKPFQRREMICIVKNQLAPLDDRWQASPLGAPAQVLHILADINLVWGSQGFTAKMGTCPVELDETYQLTLPGLADAMIRARPVWRDGDETGWLLLAIEAGREKVLAKLNSADKTVSIPITAG